MEGFHRFIGPWPRVRCGRIMLLLVLCCLLMVKADVNADSELMCYQGKIITSKTQTISLSKKSLSKFSLKKCQAPTTAEPELMTTTEITTTMSDAPSTSFITTGITETDSITTNGITTNGNTSKVTPTPDASSPPTQKTVNTQVSTAPPPTQSSKTTSPAVAMSTGGDAEAMSTEGDMVSPTNTSSGGRRRRSQDDNQLTNHGPSHDSNYTCQVFYYPTTKDDKLKVNLNYTLEFSCVTEDLCNGNNETRNVMINGNTGTLYCCNGTACNSPLLVIDDDDDTSVTVETLKNCSSYNQAGEFQSVPCVQTNTHMCLNVTNGNDTAYTCGSRQSEKTYCIKDNWYSEQCSKKDGTRYCCYVEPTFVKVVPDDDDDDVKPQNSSAGVIIGVIVAFATGLFLGFMGLLILQKKCGKGRRMGIEMDFSYSRFQSADSGTDEL